MSSEMFNALLSLGGVVIGAAAAFGGIWWQGHAVSKAAEVDARERAYLDMLAFSQNLAFRIDALVATLRAQTGLAAALDQLLGRRKPLDPMALHDWLRVDMAPLMEAWSRTWAVATPRGVDLANALLTACNDVLDVFAAVSPRTAGQKVKTAIVGAPLDELRALLLPRLRALAVARRDLAELVRLETGRPPAQLFSVTNME